MRKKIKDALATWNPDWAAKASYQCEPPTLDAPCCGAGCKLCTYGATFDCYPDGWACAILDAWGGGSVAYYCGYQLMDATPPAKCSDPLPQNKPCRALTEGGGPTQQHICDAAGEGELLRCGRDMHRVDDDA